MYFTVVWLGPLVGLLVVGTGAVSDSFVDFWYPTPHAGSLWPALMHGEVLSLRDLIHHTLLILMGDMPFSKQKHTVFCSYSWDIFTILSKNGEEWIGWWEQRGMGARRGEASNRI